jgi:hypothetical protein
MSFSSVRFTLIVGIAAFALCVGTVYAQNGGQGAQGRGGQGRGPAGPVPNADILDPARNPLPNPNPTVVKAFGILPDGRMWGSTAGVAVGPDQNVWAYDRCGTNTCEDSNLAPIFKIGCQARF